MNDILLRIAADEVSRSHEMPACPPHEFVGRRDRDCEVCDKPDRNIIHQTTLDLGPYSAILDECSPRMACVYWSTPEGVTPLRYEAAPTLAGPWEDVTQGQELDPERHRYLRLKTDVSA